MKHVPIILVAGFSLLIMVGSAGAAVEGFSSAGGNFQSLPIGTEFTVIETLPSLPAGKYIANASVVLAMQTWDPTIHYVNCIFMLDGNINICMMVFMG